MGYELISPMLPLGGPCESTVLSETASSQRSLPEPDEEVVEILPWGGVGRSQAAAWFCAKHPPYFRVIRFPVWVTVGKWRALTQRTMKLERSSRSSVA